MKQPKKLTRSQKESLSVMNLNPNDYMFIEDIGAYIKVIHKTTGKAKIVDKYLKGAKRR